MPSVSCLELQQKYPGLILQTHGDLSQKITGVSAIEHILPHTFVYVTNEKYLAAAESSACTLIIAPKNCGEKIPPSSKKTWFLSPNPELLMSFIKKDFFLPTPYKNTALAKRASNVHAPTSCTLAASVTLAPGVVLGENVTIGENTFIGANTVIEAHCTIGTNTTIHPLVYIGHSCVIGNNCEILPNTCIGSEGYGYAHDEKWNHYRIPHSGRVVLEDDVHIGANCSIDRGSIGDSVIGRGTKIDNQCHLAHNSVIGKNGLLTAQFAMAGSSTIGNNFVTGGNSSVTGHITITDNVQIGGMSGVTKSITEPGQYGGFPLQKMQDYLKTKAAIAKLVDMRETLRALVKSKGE